MIDKTKYPNLDKLERIAMSSKDLFISMISRYYPLSDSLIEKYEDALEIDNYEKIGIYAIELNDKYNVRYLKAYRYSYWWSIESLEKNKDQSDWLRLSQTTSLPWSFELIELFNDKWDWKALSQNTSIQWVINFKDGNIIMVNNNYYIKQEWYWVELSNNSSLPWSIELIEKFKRNWNWKSLSKNTGIPWTIELVEKFEEKKDSNEFKELLIQIEDIREKKEDEYQFKKSTILENRNKLSKDDLEKVLQKHYFFNSPCHSKISPLEKELNEQLKQFNYCWDWDVLSKNPSVPWLNNDFYARFKGKKTNSLPNNNIPDVDKDGSTFESRAYLTKIRMEHYTVTQIDEQIDTINWYNLSINETLPWSIDFIKKYEDRWKWDSFDEEIFENGETYTTECLGISDNIAIPWSIELINAFEDKWDWYALSGNISLPFSIEFIDTFCDRWNWEELIYSTQTNSNNQIYTESVPKFYEVLFSKLPEEVIEHLTLCVIDTVERELQVSMNEGVAILVNVEEYTSKTNIKYVKLEFRTIAAPNNEKRGHVEYLPLGGGLLVGGLKKLRNLVICSNDKNLIELYDKQNFKADSFDIDNYIKIMRLFIGNKYKLTFSNQKDKPQKLFNISVSPA
jgi:hypothetical protein